MLEHHGGGRFALSPEGAAVLADENHPAFGGGFFSQLPQTIAVLERLPEAFRTGLGLAYDAFGPEGARGIERGFAPWYRALLVPIALPRSTAWCRRSSAARRWPTSAAAAASRCSRWRRPSRARVPRLRHLAPRSRARREEPERRGGRRERHASTTRAREPLPGDASFDFVTTFDCLHDMTRPGARHARRSARALAPDGIWLIADIKAKRRLEANAAKNPMAALMYGISVLTCMSSALSEPGGAGLGTLGFTRISRADARRGRLHALRAARLRPPDERVLRGAAVTFRSVRRNPWWIPPFLGGVPEEVGPAELRILGFVTLAMFFENYDLGMLGNALPQIAATFGLDKEAQGEFAAAVRFGALPAFFLLPLADRIGRRRLLLISIAGMCIGSLATALAQSPLQFVIAQIVMRTCIVAAAVTSFVVVSEEFPANRRGWGIGMLGGVGAIGFGFGALLYGFVERLPFGWRTLYALGIAPLLFLPALARGLRETYSTLAGWIERELIDTHRRTGRSGTAVILNGKNIKELENLIRLRKGGLSLQRARHLMEDLRATGYNPLSKGLFVVIDSRKGRVLRISQSKPAAREVAGPHKQQTVMVELIPELTES